METAEIILNGKQKRYLRGQGSLIDAIVHIGKAGIVPGIVQQTRDALEARELIKVKVLSNCLEDRKEVARVLSERSGAALVQVLGRTFLLYKPRSKDPQIKFPQ